MGKCGTLNARCQSPGTPPTSSWASTAAPPPPFVSVSRPRCPSTIACPRPCRCSPGQSPAALTTTLLEVLLGSFDSCQKYSARLDFDWFFGLFGGDFHLGTSQFALIAFIYMIFFLYIIFSLSWIFRGQAGWYMLVLLLPVRFPIVSLIIAQNFELWCCSTFYGILGESAIVCNDKWIFMLLILLFLG